MSFLSFLEKVFRSLLYCNMRYKIPPHPPLLKWGIYWKFILTFGFFYSNSILSPTTVAVAPIMPAGSSRTLTALG